MTREPDDAIDPFFDELKDWSEIKLRILEKYFRAYLNFRGGKHPLLYYVDGFAGTGWYGQGGEEPKEGSPVRMAKLAQEVASSKPYRLVCINIESNLGHARRLQSALAAFDPAYVQFRPGTFSEQLPQILEDIGAAPSVFFLDPFGVKPISLGEMRPVVRRRDTELLLNLNTPTLRRMAGFEDSAAKQSAAKQRVVSEVLGEDPAGPPPEWLREWRRLANPLAWEEWAATAYMTRLRHESAELRYTLRYSIRETYRANPKYHLVFGTRSQDAISLMNDLICTEDEDLFTRTSLVRAGEQLAFTGLVEEIDHAEQARKIAELVEDVHSYGREHQGSSRAQLWWHFMTHGRFGEFKKKHYREAVLRLVDRGRARYQTRPLSDKTPIEFL